MVDARSAGTPEKTPDDAAAWLIGAGLRERTITELVQGCGERLVAAGIPLMRVHVAMRTLHPSIYSASTTWRRGTAAETERYPYHARASDTWLQSPLYALLIGRSDCIRRRIRGPDAVLDFPVLSEFRDQGATDYLACRTLFGQATDPAVQQGVLVSWLTDAPGGFTDAQIAILERMQDCLGLAIKSTLGREIAGNLLDAYVGPEAGQRVLAGAIRRGAVEAIPAVVLMSDLRGFTTVTDGLERSALPEMLNSYFDRMVEPVVEAGGEVLKYLGDGLLAIFRVHDGGNHAEVCRRAAQAAARAVRGTAELNDSRRQSGQPVMDLDVALHLGDVLYGNIGAADRLDFTVIGPVVNEVSRIESFCKALARPILASETFVHAARGDVVQFEDMGEHALRGVGRPRRLYALLT